MRGIVSGPDKKAIEGVSVTITGLLTQRQTTTTTNAKGLYTAIISPGESEYIISFRRIGFAPQSLHALRTGMSPVLITNSTMTEIVQVLDDRTVVARAGAGAADGKSIGGNDRDILVAALFSLNPSDMLALAANVPGVMMIAGANGADSGYSVLGMGANDNNMMVDGALVKGNTLPSLSVATATMATNTYDIMRGGFSGGQLSITTRAGTDVFELTGNSTMTNNHLTWSDPSVQSQAPSSIRASLGGGGPIIKRKLNYFAALDVNTSITKSYSLINANPALLEQYGVLPDSVTALRNELIALGIPLTLNSVPDGRESRGASGSLRLDYRPKATTTATLNLRGNWSRNGSSGYSPLSFPMAGSQGDNKTATAQLTFSGYLAGMLNTLNASYNVNDGTQTPYSMIPSGSVRFGSVFPDGRTGLTTLSFGSGGQPSGGTSWSYNVTNELSVLTTNSKHKFKLGTGLTSDNYNQNATVLGLGRYSFLSLTDLAAGRPASYSRNLNARRIDYGGTTGFVGLQDEFQASGKLQFSFGMRTDLAKVGRRPERNPVVDSLYGYRNDVIPHSIGLIPRFGFSWTPTKGNAPKPAAAGAAGPGAGPDLSAAMVRELAAASAGGRVVLSAPSAGGAGAPIPTGSIPGLANARLVTFTGGISLQRGIIDPRSISTLVDATGLPTTSRSLTCLGAAAPIPVWGTNELDAPTTCLDGTGPIELTTARPRVSFYDPSFKPNGRWSASVGVSGLQWKKWSLQASGSYNLGVNISSSLDMNLRRDTSFTVSREANRPVYVDAANIVPTSGGISPNASRIHPQFGSVSRMVSDLQNRNLQFQFSIVPPKPLFGKLAYSINYTWLPYSKSLLRGLGGGGEYFSEGGGEFYSFGGGASNTDGDPFRKEWAPGVSPTHAINTSTSYRVWWFTLSLRAAITSGIPYTPMIAGDINGDGSSNDRAYVYNPSLVSDPELAAQMNTLLAGSSASIRQCLEQQFEQIAARNSCKTPWNVRTDLTLGFTPPKTLGFGDRLKFSAGLVNAGSAIVRITGLKNSILGRSQNYPSANGTLMTVTGFDPQTREYKYRVNQLFGLPYGYGTTNTRTPPFQVRLAGEFKLGGPPRAPMATGLGLVPPSKDPVLTQAEVMKKLRQLTTDPVAPILKFADTLRLTPQQVNTIQQLGEGFFIQADSVFAPLAEFIVSKGRKMTDLELNTKLPKARTDVQKLMVIAKGKATEVLTPAQKLLLPVVSGAAPAPSAAPPKAGGGEY